MWIADFVNVIVLTMRFAFMMESLYSVCIAVLCPIGAITINEIGQATKCDLCEGYDTQQCVEACPTKALTNDTEKIIHDKQEKISEGFRKVQTLLK